jgi:hypothetical protein
MSFKIIWREKGKSKIIMEGLTDYKSREDAEQSARTLHLWQQWYDMSIEPRP